MHTLNQGWLLAAAVAGEAKAIYQEGGSCKEFFLWLLLPRDSTSKLAPPASVAFWLALGCPYSGQMLPLVWGENSPRVVIPR